jgi:hypothetical protein
MADDKAPEPRIFGFSIETAIKIAALLIGLGGLYEKVEGQFDKIDSRLDNEAAMRDLRSKQRDQEFLRMHQDLDGRKAENDEHFKTLQGQLNRLLDMTQGGRNGNDGVPPGWKR